MTEIFCSYIIPTIGRSTLERAVRSVLEQDFDPQAREVVVVNDSGQPLPPAEWQASPRVQMIDTQRRERSFARNSGAAVARGRYLAFLDDDDWLLPGALTGFQRLAEEHEQAVWLYGGIRIVNESGSLLAEINSGLKGNCFASIMGGAWAPLQASMIQAEAFFRLGGFDPFINGTEDEDLCRRAALTGDFANMAQAAACLFRGQDWNTSTNYLRAPRDTQYSRDRILSQPGAQRRLLASARSSYWHGRIMRVYLSTIGWNLRQKRLFSALSRLLYTGTGAVQTLPHFFRAAFWQGVRAEHVPESLHFVMRAYEQGQVYQPAGLERPD